MPTYFEQYTDDDGNIQYRETEVTVDLFDDDAIRQAKAYKELLAEQVKTRQDRTKLKQELEKLSKQADDEQPEPPEPPKAEDKTPAVDPAEIARLVMEQLRAEQSAQSAQEKRITELLTKHKLPESLRPVLAQVNDPENVALTLSQNQYSFEKPEKPDLLEQVKEKTKQNQDNVPDAVRKLFAR